MLKGIIDVAAGIARFGGKEELYYKSLRSFVETYNQLPDENNKEEYVRHIHTVKGVAGNLGITQLYDIAVAFNADPHNEELRDKYITIFDETAKLVLENVESKQAPDVNKSSGSSAELLEQLAMLKTAVEGFNITLSEDIVAKIGSTNWDLPQSIDFAPLKNASASYDFIAMNELVSDLINKLS